MSVFAAVVLAGGAARRMGGATKPARMVAGTTLLARVLAAVADARPRIVVGPGELVPLLPRGVSLTTEEPGGGGPAAAAAAGLTLLAGMAEEHDDSQVAVLAGDLPFVSVQTIDALRRGLGTDADGAVLVDDGGRPQWLCGVWRTRALLSRVITQGDPAGRGMRELVDGMRILRVTVTDPTRPPAWFDCDTEEDLRRAEEWAYGDVE